LTEKQNLAAQRADLLNQPKSRESPEQIKANLERIIQPLARLADTWRSLQPPFRTRFERLMFPGGYVIGKSRTADLGLLFSLFSRSEPQMSSEVPPDCLRSNPEMLDVFEEIKEFIEILDGVEEDKGPPKRRFDCSHRAKPRMTESNQDVRES
jgi:hypothetical protein